MAESVQYFLERMLPDLEEMQKLGIFSATEIKSIVRKRTDFEYKLKRKIALKEDFLQYLEYELNLEELRKLRKQKLGLEGEKRVCDVAFIRHIMNLGERLVRKFRGDVYCWMQFIDIARRIGKVAAIPGIYGRAIQSHPLDERLWISAASWELTHAENISVARHLMQRALRIMEEQPRLWHEYFKLELLYAQQLSESNETTKKNTATDSEGDAVESIHVDKLPLETEQNAEKVSASTSEQLKSGEIAKIVYLSAIRSSADSVQFRAKFAEIAREFGFHQIEDLIFDSIKENFPDSPEAISCIIERHLWDQNLVSAGVKNLHKLLDPIIQEYSVAMQEHGSEELSKLFFNCIKRAEQIGSSGHWELFKNFKLNALKTCKKYDHMSLSLYLEWISIVDEKHVEPILEMALASFPASVELWELKLKQFSRGNFDTLLASALNAVSEQDATHLWQLAADQCIEHATKFDKSLALALEAIVIKAVLNDQVALHCLLRTHAKFGIREERTLFKIFANLLQRISQDVAIHILELELKESTVHVGSVRFVFDAVVKLRPFDEDLWLQYLKFEISQNRGSEVNTLYWKAAKLVNDKTKFAVEYDRMVNSAQA